MPAQWAEHATEVLMVRVPADQLDPVLSRVQPAANSLLYSLAAQGLSRAEIARRLGVSTRTVDRRLAEIRDSLGVQTLAEVAGRLAAAGW